MTIQSKRLPQLFWDYSWCHLWKRCIHTRQKGFNKEYYKFDNPQHHLSWDQRLDIYEKVVKKGISNLSSLKYIIVNLHSISEKRFI